MRLGTFGTAEGRQTPAPIALEQMKFEICDVEQTSRRPSLCAASVTQALASRTTPAFPRASPAFVSEQATSPRRLVPRLPSRPWTADLAQHATQATLLMALALEGAVGAARGMHSMATQRVESLCSPLAGPHLQRYLLSRRKRIVLADVPAFRLLSTLCAGRRRQPGTIRKWDLQHYTWSNSTVRRLAKQGLAAQKALDVHSAIQYFTRALELEPNDPALLLLLAKQWTDMSLLLSRDASAHAQRVEVNERAVSLAERAIQIAPDCVPALVVLGMACGRLAAGQPVGEEVDDPLSPGKKSEKVPSLGEARQRAVRAGRSHSAASEALRLDDTCDGAYHLHGRLLDQLARLGGPALCALAATGVRLPRGSMSAALMALRRAVELAPGRAAHRAELGRLLIGGGREEDAERELRKALGCAVEDINDWQAQTDAKSTLLRLEQRRRQRAVLENNNDYLHDKTSISMLVSRILEHPLLVQWSKSFPLQAAELWAQWQVLVDSLAHKVHRQISGVNLQPIALLAPARPRA